MQRVIVAFEKEANSAKIREAVESDGIGCLVCRSAAEVKRTIHEQRVFTVICGFKLRDEVCADLFQDLPDGCAMLMIGPQNRLELCETEGIFKLPSPVSRGDLLASVHMLLQLRRHTARKNVPAQRSEEEKRLVSRAKEVLMDRYDMTEAQAHRFLQKESMDHGTKLTETARLVLSEP